MSTVCRILLLLLLTLCFLTPRAIASPTVLFDEYHAQQFLTGNSGPLDLSELATLYVSNGFTVETNSAPLSSDVLSSIDVLVLSGPFKPLEESEIEAVVAFIKSGGGLAIMLHIAPPMKELLQRLDIDYTNAPVREARNVIDGNPLNFKVDSLAEHPVTSGLQSFSVYGSWALMGTAAHTKVIAETTQHGWVDMDRDNQLSQGDAVQVFGVMVGGELGGGRYVVLGDDAVFQNRFLDEQNRKLALQIVDWLSYRLN